MPAPGYAVAGAVAAKAISRGLVQWVEEALGAAESGVGELLKQLTNTLQGIGDQCHLCSPLPMKVWAK